MKATELGIERRMFMAKIPAYVSKYVKPLPETIFINPVVSATTQEQFTHYEASLSAPSMM